VLSNPRSRWTLEPSLAGASAIAILSLAAPAQERLWTRQFGTPGWDEVSAITLDGAGGLFLSGRTAGSLAGSSAGSTDAWLARCDGAGNRLWIQQMGTSDIDDGQAVAPDGSGGVYVCGRSNGSLGGPNAGLSDAWLARYDGMGDQLWIRQFGRSGGEFVSGAAPDDIGGVYLCGYATHDPVGPPYYNIHPCWLARFDKDGNTLWDRKVYLNYNGYFDYALDVCPDGEGGVFVCGYMNPGSGFRVAWLARCDGGGNQLWRWEYEEGEIELEAHALAPDGMGGAYVCGTKLEDFWVHVPSQVWVARVGGSGILHWIRHFGSTASDYVGAAAPDRSGGVYVTGRTDGTLGGHAIGATDTWLARYGASGTQLWMLQLGTTKYDAPFALAADGVGRVFVGGSTAGDLGGQSQGNNDAWLAGFEVSCSAWPFCDSAINSSGLGASIGYEGSTSIGQNDLMLTVTGCPPKTLGFFFLGLQQTHVPFGGGWLCVTGGPQQLLPVVSLSASGTGKCRIDFTDPDSPASLISPGLVRHFQFWYRDTTPAGPSFNLSNGLTAQFCP